MASTPSALCVALLCCLVAASAVQVHDKTARAGGTFSRASGALLVKQGREGVRNGVGEAALLHSVHEDGDSGVMSAFFTSLGDTTLPQWLFITLSAFEIIIGLFQCFAGYKHFKATVFVVAFYTVGVVMFYVLQTAVSDSVEHKEWYTYAGALGAGLVAGTLFSFFVEVAVFLIGASIGVVVTCILQPVALSHISPEHSDVVFYVFLGVLAVVFGVLVVWLERPLIIVASALLGAFMVTAAACGVNDKCPSKFSGSFEQFGDVEWAYFGGFVALAVLGLLVQFLVTAKGVDHKADRRRPKEADAYDYYAAPDYQEQPAPRIAGVGIHYT